MSVEQIYTGCLAQGAYYIESKGEAIIIDPLREVEPYLSRAEKSGAKIKYILETHFHADFVSGHVTLAKKTGADIVYGPNAQPDFDIHQAKDGEILTVGDLKIKVLHTPGHTLESTCYLLLDENDKETAIFTGDTLFLGDVGRPDLAQKMGSITIEDLAGMLYDSLRNKIMPLSDDIIVYPGHGAGSACGKSMMTETIDSLGHQKEMNYALRSDMTKEEFISEVTDGLLPPPAYFPLNAALNKQGYADIDDILNIGTKGYDPEAFEAIVNAKDALVLDVRHQTDFVQGFIPKSIFIGIDGSFAPWVGALIRDVKQPIAIVADEERVEEAITRLARVGFDNTIGYLKGGVKAWGDAGKELDEIESISPEYFESNFSTELEVIDVRKESEYEAGHIENAALAPLDFINDHLDTFKSDQKSYVHCKGGYRSVIAISILKSRGIHNLVNLEGGYTELSEKKLPFVQPV